MAKRFPFFSGVLVLGAMIASSVACRNASMTAGRPGAEESAAPGSVIATRAGTGDPRVGPHGDSGAPAVAPEKTANVDTNKEPEEKDTGSGKGAAPAHQR